MSDEPAFPGQVFEAATAAESRLGATGFYRTVSGLTKREYAAIMAMQGLLTGANQVYHDELAKIAVEQADALLAALKEKL